MAPSAIDVTPVPIPSSVQNHYDHLTKVYTASNPKSLAHYQQALTSLPGGNTRTVLFYPPFPLCIKSAHGSTITTQDSQDLTDFLGEYTAGLYGHSHPLIISTMMSTLQNGLNFGSHHAGEARLADLVCERFESMELVCFTNSGTEANLMAIAAAKIFTARKKVLIFRGGYHGGVLSFAGGGNAVNVPHEWLVATYNDLQGASKLIEENGGELAAVLVEPMLGSGGAIPGTPEFLRMLRSKTREAGAMLIFDEVMTSRLYEGSGVQGHLNIMPDLTTLGKYIGGGSSFGAFGGRRDIMDLFDPRKGGVSHAGTFNNNVLSMAAGSVGLEQIFTKQVAKSLHVRGEALIQSLRALTSGTLMRITGCGSLLNIHFTGTPVAEILCPEDAKGDSKLSDLLHLYLIGKGLYIARRGFVALSLAIEDVHIDQFVQCVREFLKDYSDLVRE